MPFSTPFFYVIHRVFHKVLLYIRQKLDGSTSPLFGRICNPTTVNIGICNAEILAQNIIIIRNHPMNSHWQISPM